MIPTMLCFEFESVSKAETKFSFGILASLPGTFQSTPEQILLETNALLWTEMILMPIA